MYFAGHCAVSADPVVAAVFFVDQYFVFAAVVVAACSVRRYAFYPGFAVVAVCFAGRCVAAVVVVAALYSADHCVAVL